MTIAEQAKALEAALQDWAEANKGRVFVASDVPAAVDVFRARPGAPTAAVLWWSEEPRGDAALGLVDRVFKVVLSRWRGLALETGKSLTEGTAGGKPMFDLVEEARKTVQDQVRLVGVPEEEETPVYQGSGPFEVDGLVLDAVELRFGLAAVV